ncbi:MAG: hypothetical protein ACRDIB_07535 [Ardenticatenaceae bacterium]
MKVQPMLGEWAIPRIRGIESLERRAFREFPVPGRVGSLFQDLNTDPTRILLTGSIYSDEARDAFLEAVRAQYQTGEPVTFVADIITATEVQYVIIERLHFVENATRPDQTDYLILLRESPPPPPPPDPLGGLDSSLLDQAGDFLDAVTGALDALDALGSIPDFGDPTAPLQDTLSGVESALSDLGGVTAALEELFGGSQ